MAGCRGKIKSAKLFFREIKKNIFFSLGGE